MKPITFFLFLWFSITAAAQSISTEDGAAAAVITKSGVPAGAKTEVKVTKDGGRLKSSDGKIELLIPPGAVSKKTDISIQPVTNEMPNGNGKAYRLEPSGILFQKPIQLVFHYDEEAVKDSMQLLLGIAMQQEDGRWYNLNKFALDTTAKTISGSINHFSDWSNFSALKLYPTSARVKVKKSLELSIDVVSSVNNDLTSLVQEDLSLLSKQSIAWTAVWRANEIHKGNGTVGTIADVSQTMATYKAPVSVPVKNPVAVTADLSGLTYKYKGVVFKDLKLVSNILVYDNAYEVTMIGSINGSAGSQLGMANYSDIGSFVVFLESGNARIIEKLNNNQLDEVGYRGKCIVSLLKSGTGMIHITGVHRIKLIPATSPQTNAWVEVVFIKAPVQLSVLQITCPPVGRGGWTTMNTSGANAIAVMRALPAVVTFEAKEEEQTILQIGEEGDEVFVKFTVKQLKED
jgi:hypothetical protein